MTWLRMAAQRVWLVGCLVVAALLIVAGLALHEDFEGHDV
jgi:beta-lactamase regulating signal transducer with metallopeptidase domain